MLSESSLKQIAHIFCGDTEGYYEYKTGEKLVKFFNSYYRVGDVYRQGFPSRWIYVYDKLVDFINTNNFDKVIQVEVGALMVGRIKNNHEEYEYKKGEEKGYFEFGGSTIVLLFKKGVITLDNDILENSKENIETIVKYGEKIGKNTFITKVKSTIKFIVK